MSQHIKQLMPRSELAQLASEKAAATAQKGNGTEQWLLRGVVWQCCQDCKNVFYPAQPLCPACLSEHYAWQHDEMGSTLVSCTNLHVSFSELFAGKAPCNIGLVVHPNGPRVFAFLADELNQTDTDVALFTVPDGTGQAVFVAVAPSGDAMTKAATIAAGLAVPAG